MNLIGWNSFILNSEYFFFTFQKFSKLFQGFEDFFSWYSLAWFPEAVSQQTTLLKKSLARRYFVLTELKTEEAFFSDERSIFLNNIRSIDKNILSGSDSWISEKLLFGIWYTKNTSILNTTSDYVLSTKRLNVPLNNSWFVLKHLRIEDISFKFYCLNVKWFTKFLRYYIIGLGI